MATCGNDRFLFIHVPKTGGMWVTEALQEAGVEVEEEIGATPEHPLLSELERRGRFTFAFVREPLSWYASIWKFRNYFHLHKGPTEGQLPYDRFIELDFPATPDDPIDPPAGLVEAVGARPRHVGRSRFDFLFELDDETAVRNVRPDFGSGTCCSRWARPR